MRLLVLGGSGFLGHHLVVDALAAGHEVTVFSRSGRALDGVAVIRGDRTGDLGGLGEGEWDAVVDTFTDASPGAPAIAETVRLLSGRAGAYCYVSGMSVYAPDGPKVPDESAPVRDGRYSDDDPLQARSLSKLAGEAAVTAGFDGPALFPRVGIMVGPRDPSHRFTYWPVRIARALRDELPRRILLPGDPDRAVQYSDARDIAGWMVRMLAAGRGGTFNTVGPGRPDSLREVLGAALIAAGGRPDDVEFVPVPETALRDAVRDVEEEERPLWFPEDQIPQAAIDSSAALAAGLTFRPAEQTARETLAWAEQNGDDGLTGGAVAQREQRIIRTAAR